MWLELHDGDNLPIYVNMDNVVDFRWYDTEKFTCLITTAPFAEKLHQLYVRETAREIMSKIQEEQLKQNRPRQG